MAVGALYAPSLAAAAGDLTPTPAQLEFGIQDIHNGQTGSQSAKFENLTGEALTVTTVQITGPDAADFSRESGCGFVNDGESCNVNVAFDPGTPGAKSAQLELVDDNGTVVVPLAGTGATGTLSGTPPTFYPQPFYYGGQQQSVEIFNGSSFAVEGTSAAISGPDAAFFSIGYNGCQFVLQPGQNCSVGVNFNPTESGTKTAQLEFSNDGTANPLDIPMSATALAGPKAVISPSDHDFGSVALGSTSPPLVLSVSNAGDAPLQIQQLLVLSGAPQLFPVANDSCSQQTILPGANCQVSVRFQPAVASSRDATIFAITNQNGPVVTSSLTGTGAPLPHGSALLVGSASSGARQSCIASGYPDGTHLAYQWLRNGQPVVGAESPQFILRNADIGSRLACRVQATNSVGSETITSLESPRIAPRLLSELSGSIVGSPLCRVLRAPGRVELGSKAVKLTYGRPITPSAALRVSAPGLRVKALIDGRPVASGQGTVIVAPRVLHGFADGSHIFQVRSKASEARVPIKLAQCSLAVALDGGPDRATKVTVSSSAGMTDPVVQLPSSLRIHPDRATLGTASIRISGQAEQTFSLYGPRTSSNGITVLLRASSVAIRHLPPEVGVVSVRLNRGVVEGHGGSLRARATVLGAATMGRANGRTVWRR